MTDQAFSTVEDDTSDGRRRVRAKDLRTWSVIKQKIDECGVSRARILRMSNLSEQAMHRGLRRGSKPRYATRVRIADALNQVAMRKQRGWL